MNILDHTIAQIQTELASETDPEVFTELLDLEKKGKKRKVLKRWFRERIKDIKRADRGLEFLQKPPEPIIIESPMYAPRIRTDPITGIKNIG